MSEETKYRYILAPTHGNPEGDDAFVLVRVSRKDVAMAADAMGHAYAFDVSPSAQGYADLTELVTPPIYTEHVLCALPEWLEEWMWESNPHGTEACFLMPLELHGKLDELVKAWELDPSLRWDSDDLRFRCSLNSARMVIREKCTDLVLFTMDVAPIITSLASSLGHDFLRPSLRVVMPLFIPCEATGAEEGAES